MRRMHAFALDRCRLRWTAQAKVAEVPSALFILFQGDEDGSQLGQSVDVFTIIRPNDNGQDLPPV